MAGVSFVLHDALPLAALFSARLPPELELLEEDELPELELDEFDELEELELLDDDELDELDDELLDDEVVPSHTPRFEYQPQLGQYVGGTLVSAVFAWYSDPWYVTRSPALYVVLEFHAATPLQLTA